MDGVILVWVSREVQIERLMSRDGISAIKAEQKISSQLPIDQKRHLATWIIDNSHSKAQTFKQVEKLWKEIFGSYHS